MTDSIDPRVMEGHFEALLIPNQFEAWLTREASYRPAALVSCDGEMNTPLQRYLAACNKYHFVYTVVYSSMDRRGKWGLLHVDVRRPQNLWDTILRAELPDWAKEYQAALAKYNVFDPAVNQTQIRPEYALAVWYGSRGDTTHYA